MAEGVTGHTDENGEYVESRFQYTPVPPPDRSGMSGINPAYVEWEMQNRPVNEAMKAVDAAIQYQGLRGYQEALKNGEPAEKAMAKFGPMIFRSSRNSFGSAVKALTPPAMTPYQTNQSALAREKFEFEKQQKAAPVKPVIRSANKGVYSIDPVTGKATAIIAPPPGLDPAAKSRQGLLESRIKTTRNLIAKTPESLKDTWAPLIDSAIADEAELEQLLAPKTATAPAAAPAPAPQAAPVAAAPQPTVPESVVMTNPKGQRVRVPQGDVERAKKLGYK